MEVEPGSERVIRLAPAIAVLRVDQVTAEIVAALREAGIPSIVLKGPAIAAWLYGDGTPRPYIDTDLLVDPQTLGDAERVIQAAGFHRGRPGWQEVSFAWRRDSDGSLVDLHSSLFGVEATPNEIWSVLSSEAGKMRVGGGVVEVPSQPALAFHVALHAAQHGTEMGKPIADLTRALQLATEDTWSQAAAIAVELRATAGFAAGLRLDPRGAALIERLGLETESSTAVTLHAEGAPPLTLGIEHLAAAPDWSARLRFLARKLVPTPRALRAQSALARRGPLGLVMAYLWRPFWLLARAPRALIAWRRARRATQQQVGGASDVNGRELQGGD